MKIGHARVSTDEQNLDLQRAALETAGCERVFEDRGISGAESARPGLAAALGALGPGDVLTDRLETGSPRALPRATHRHDRRHRKSRGRVSVAF